MLQPAQLFGTLVDRYKNITFVTGVNVFLLIKLLLIADICQKLKAYTAAADIWLLLLLYHILMLYYYLL